MLKVAIFGGSFDPIHIGHQAIIQKILQTLDIDKLILVPTFLNPFKKKFFFTPEQRIEFLNILYKTDPKIIIEDFEIRQNKPTQSIKTIEYIKQKYKPSKLYFVIGADNLKELHLWDNFGLIKQYVRFVVVTRENYQLKANCDIQFDILEVKQNISSTQIRLDLKNNLKYIPKQIHQLIYNYVKI